MLSSFIVYTRKSAGIFVLLLLTLAARAQDDTVVYDTTIVTSTEPATEEDDKDETTHPFSNRIDTLSVDQRTIPPAAVNKMKEDEDFWYANSTILSKAEQQRIIAERERGKQIKKKKNEQGIQEEEREEYTPVGQRSWFQTLLWIVIIGVFATGLIFYLGSSNVGLFRKKNRRVGEEGDQDDTITEDIFAINYQKDIDRAAAQGNYRLAIRLLFLRLLKNMSEKNIIRYKQDKTNLDYLIELHPTAYYNGFFRVTRNYEYSWYGQFNVSEQAYQLIRTDFDQFDKELR